MEDIELAGCTPKDSKADWATDNSLEDDPVSSNVSSCLLDTERCGMSSMLSPKRRPSPATLIKADWVVSLGRSDIAGARGRKGWTSCDGIKSGNPTVSISYISVYAKLVE